MSFAAVVLIGLGAFALVLIIVYELVQILSEGGVKLLFWPKLNHGYEVAPVVRLAIAPWAILLFGFAANGMSMLIFGHDLLGHLDNRYIPWLVLAVVPVLMIHLIDYQRSVVAAAASFLVLAAGTVYVLHFYNAWGWLPATLPFLLWGLNGIRATHADRVMG
jgi:hypothetical protein